MLLIIFNITGGLFPDPSFSIPVYLQNIIVYGVGFLVAGYFPFYFYKAFDLKLLRFHAFYGVPLCFMLPYLIFFVISYSMHEDMDFTIRYVVIIPFFYSVVLLVAILRAIRVAYRENRNRKFYLEEIAVYCSFAPWSLMAIVVYFKFGQLAKVLFTPLQVLRSADSVQIA